MRTAFTKDSSKGNGDFLSGKSFSSVEKHYSTMTNEGHPKHKKYPHHSLGKKTHFAGKKRSSIQHGATTYALKRKEEHLGKKDAAPPKGIIALREELVL